MSGYKNFAVVGVGLLGAPIIEELLKAKVDKLVILSRPESASKHTETYAARGATVVPVADYSSVADVSKALSGVEVVISTLTHNVLNLQVPIAEAAKAAGVQLFVPSEFGSATDTVTEGMMLGKKQLSEKIRTIVPTALFYTGAFSDWVFNPFLNLDLKSGSVGVGGDGNAEASFTSVGDISRYVAYVLTTLPRAELKNRTFRIEGEHTTLNEVFAAYEKKHSVNLQVRHTSIEELEEKIKQNPHDVASYLSLVWAKGGGPVGSPVDNGLFPDWNPKPVIDYL